MVIYVEFQIEHIFWSPDTCSFNMRRSCWKYFEFYFKFSRHTVDCLHMWVFLFMKHRNYKSNHSYDNGSLLYKVFLVSFFNMFVQNDTCCKYFSTYYTLKSFFFWCNAPLGWGGFKFESWWTWPNYMELHTRIIAVSL